MVRIVIQTATTSSCSRCFAAIQQLKWIHNMIFCFTGVATWDQLRRDDCIPSNEHCISGTMLIHRSCIPGVIPCVGISAYTIVIYFLLSALNLTISRALKPWNEYVTWYFASQALAEMSCTETIVSIEQTLFLRDQTQTQYLDRRRINTFTKVVCFLFSAANLTISTNHHHILRRKISLG